MKKNITIKINIPGRRQLSWHADSGQLHFTIDQSGRRAAGAALKLRATSHSCYVIRYVRPGRILGLAAFKANGPGRGRVLGQTETLQFCGLGLEESVLGVRFTPYLIRVLNVMHQNFAFLILVNTQQVSNGL